MSGGELPQTGIAITILGISVGLSWIIGIAVALILMGVIMLRFASRAERRASP